VKLGLQCQSYKQWSEYCIFQFYCFLVRVVDRFCNSDEAPMGLSQQHRLVTCNQRTALKSLSLCSTIVLIDICIRSTGRDYAGGRTVQSSILVRVQANLQSTCSAMLHTTIVLEYIVLEYMYQF
jgi:hypothetical protein